jgi:hypothetical protein
VVSPPAPRRFGRCSTHRLAQLTLAVVLLISAKLIDWPMTRGSLPARELVGGLDRETWPGFGGARFGYSQQAE